MTVRIAPHRGEPTTHALVTAVVGDAAFGDESGPDVTILLSGAGASDLASDSVLIAGVDDPAVASIADRFAGRVIRIG